MESMIYIKTYDLPKIDEKALLRYAGCLDESEDVLLLAREMYDEVSEAVLLLAREMYDEVSEAVACKVCYRRFSVSFSEGIIDLGFASLNSHSLESRLIGCNEIILFCATIGHGIDRLISKYSITSPSKAVILQAIATERIESLCDLFCREMALEEAGSGREARPRFSPGYGDLPLELQREVFASLDCARKIGVSLSESLFMRPTKSVSAIIGVKSL